MRFAGVRVFEMIEGAWTSEYASVASFPAYLRVTENRINVKVRNRDQRCDILAMPPGCVGANSVIFHTLPSTAIQRSVAVLCFESSIAVIRLVFSLKMMLDLVKQ